MDYGEETASEGNYYNDRSSMAGRNISVKESPVTRELISLSKATANLMAEAGQLEQRLAGVLRMQPESVPNGKPEESLTEIPSEIRRQRETVDNVAYVLRSILSRLEL